MIPSKLKVVELRAELSARGLDSKGVKAVLVERLEEALKNEDSGGNIGEDEDADTPVAEDTQHSQSDSDKADQDREEAIDQADEPSRGSDSRDSEDLVPQTQQQEVSAEESQDSRDQEEESQDYQEVEQQKELTPEKKQEFSPEKRRDTPEKHKEYSPEKRQEYSPEEKERYSREYSPDNKPDQEEDSADSHQQHQDKLADQEMARFDQEGEDTDYNKNNHEGMDMDQYGEENYSEEKGEFGDVKPDVSDKQHDEEHHDDVDMKPDMSDIKQEDDIKQERGEDNMNEERDKSHERGDHRRDRRRDREDRERDDSRGRKRRRSSERSPTRPAVKEDEPTIDENAVTLSWYDSDLNLRVDKQSLFSATPLSEHGFGYIWAGARSTYGFTQGKICYQVKLVENNDVSHLEDEPNPNVLRVGWSTFDNSLQLGEEKLSYGFGGTGKISENCKFADYGKPYTIGDVVTAYLDITDESAIISFAVNEENFDAAYTVSLDTLEGKALVPHVLTKNIKFEVNFGQMEEPWFATLPEFVFPVHVPLEERVRGPVPPPTRDQCEMIMMCGLPAAGKTVWANDHAKAHPEKRYNIIGTNALIDKMKVMGLPRKMNYAGRWDNLIEKCTRCLQKLMDIGCGRRRNYILDQTNVYPGAQRRKMRNFEGFIKKAVVIVPTDEEFKERTEKREKEEGKDVPDSAVMEMKANFTLPEKEMFNEVLFIELQEEEAKELVEKYNKEAIEQGFTRLPPPRERGNSNKRFRRSPGRNYRGYNDRRGGRGGGPPRRDGWGGPNRNRFDNFDRRGPPPMGRFRGGGGGGGMGNRNGGGWNRGPDNRSGGGGGGGGGWRHGGQGDQRPMGQGYGRTGGGGGGGGGGGWRGAGGGGGGPRGGSGGGRDGGGGGFRGRRDGPPRRDDQRGGPGGQRDNRNNRDNRNYNDKNKGNQHGQDGQNANQQQVAGQNQWNPYQTQQWGQQGWGQGWGQQAQAGWGQAAAGWGQQMTAGQTNQQWNQGKTATAQTTATQQAQQGYPAAYATQGYAAAYPGYNNWQGYQQAYQAAYAQQGWAQQAATTQQATTQQTTPAASTTTQQ